MADLMVSYARENTTFVDRLPEALVAEGLSLWIDKKGLLPTAPVRQEIFAAIRESSAVILVLSPDWVDSAFCAQELAYSRSQNKRLIPLLVEPIAEAKVDPALADINWIRFDQIPFDEAVSEIGRAFRLDLDRVRLHARLLQRAQLWEEKEEPSRLLRSRELVEAETWLSTSEAGGDSPPTALQLRFILQSRKSETARQRRTLAITISALVLVSFLATAAILAYRTAEARRKTAQSRLMAAESDSHADENLDQSLLLAAHAYAIAPTLEARGALLRQTYEHQWITRTLWGGKGGIEGLSIRADGRVVAAGDSSGHLLLWHSETGKLFMEPIAANSNGDIVADVQFRPGSSELVAGSMNGELWTFRLEADRVEKVAEQEFPAPLYALAYSSDGHLLAVGDLLGVVTLLDPSAPTTADRRTYPPERDAPTLALGFSHSSRLLAIGRGDRRIILQDLEDPSVEPRILSLEEPIAGLAFGSDDATLIVGSGETILVYHLDNLEEPAEIHTLSGQVLSMAVSADEHWILAGLQSGLSEMVYLEGAEEEPHLRGHRGRLRSTALAGNLLATGGADGRVFLGSLSADTPWVTHSVVHRSDPSFLAFDPAGKSLASADMASLLVFWNGDDGNQEVRQISELESIDYLDWSADGRELLLIGSEEGVVILDRQSVEPVIKAAKIVGLVAAVFQANSKQSFAFNQKGEVLQLNEELEEQSKCEPPSALGSILAVSPNQHRTRIAFGTAEGILGEVDPITCQYHIAPQDPEISEIFGIAFQADGRLLAITSSGDMIVWDPNSKTMPTRKSTGNDRLMSFALSPAGNLMALGNAMGEIELWDPEEGRRIGPPIPAHEMFVETLAFDPSGSLLASAGNDGRLEVWNANPESWASLACQMASRSLTSAELDLFDLRDAKPCSQKKNLDLPWPSAVPQGGFEPPKPGVRMLGDGHAIVQRHHQPNPNHLLGILALGGYY